MINVVTDAQIININRFQIILSDSNFQFIPSSLADKNNGIDQEVVHYVALITIYYIVIGLWSDHVFIHHAG